MAHAFSTWEQLLKTITGVIHNSEIVDQNLNLTYVKITANDKIGRFISYKCIDSKRLDLDIIIRINASLRKRGGALFV